TIHEFDNIGASDRSTKEISDLFASTLKLISSARRSKVASMEANTMGSTLEWENSSFLASQSAGAPQAALHGGFQNHQIESGNPYGAMECRTKSEGDAARSIHSQEQLLHAPTQQDVRRVVVCSPANVPLDLSAPSIDQEKMRRREAIQPKSIM